MSEIDELDDIYQAQEEEKEPEPVVIPPDHQTQIDYIKLAEELKDAHHKRELDSIKKVMDLFAEQRAVLIKEQKEIQEIANGMMNQTANKPSDYSHLFK